MSTTDRGIVLHQIDRLFRDGTLAGLGDGQLLERFRTRRDEAAFESLVELHGPMVLGLCRRFLRDPRDIEDAFQATFLVLVRKAPEIRDGGLLANWLYGVALRVATRARANLLRRRGREHAIGDRDPAATPNANEVLGMGPVLDQELSRLPAKYRAPLVLCYLRGQTHDQAAQELRCPVGTVRSRMARGRDLLKRRLTRQGYAPTAALFGAGLELPARLLTETVPANLVAATVEAAFAVGSSQSFQAGAAAASALALTQGVLTSMKFAQVKWISLAIVATGLSAGTAVAWAAVRTQGSTATTGRSLALAGTDESQESATTGSTTTATAGQPNAKTTEERLRGLEDQIEKIYRLSGITHDDPVLAGAAPDAPTLDRLEAKLNFLINSHNRTPTRPTATTSSSSSSGTTSTGTTASTDDPVPSRAATAGSSSTTRAVGPTGNFTARAEVLPRPRDGSGTKIREVEVELKLARLECDSADKLQRKAMISAQEYQQIRCKFELPLARLQGMDDDLADEIDRLKLEIRRKKAELDQANGQTAIGQALVSRNQRLNTRKPGMVAAEDVTRVEAEFRAAQAGAQVKEIELQEAELHLAQLDRRRARIAKIIEATTSPSQ